MMSQISRRKFIYFSAALPFISQIPVFAAESKSRKSAVTYPITSSVLQTAFIVEMTAYNNYIGYTAKALNEKYPNIAYLFHSFSNSEKIHADNYKSILTELRQETKSRKIDIDVLDTKSNLQKAAQNEIEKINSIYPDFLKKLETEAYDKAIISCMYSLKSHQQHEKKVKDIMKYSEMFFGIVARKIEGQNLDFYVCRVCGSTIDKAPLLPCDICNRSISNYSKVERPT